MRVWSWASFKPTASSTLIFLSIFHQPNLSSNLHLPPARVTRRAAPASPSSFPFPSLRKSREGVIRKRRN